MKTDHTWGLGGAVEATLSREATDLILYAENTYGIYRGYLVPMYKAAQRKYNGGVGDYEKLLKGFTRIAAPIARQWNLEHGTMSSKWSDTFTVSVRREFARYLAEGFLTEYHLGNRW